MRPQETDRKYRAGGAPCSECDSQALGPQPRGETILLHPAAYRVFDRSFRTARCIRRPQVTATIGLPEEGQLLHEIPPRVRERMEYLERIDARDRTDGTPQVLRLRQVPPEVGRFLALLAASSPPGSCLEIGTSAGYSTLWLALACREVGKRVTTFELLENKARLASETFAEAGVEDVVTLVVGDALRHLGAYTQVAFCFLDAEKEQYVDLYDALVPNLVPGGLLIADNVISHRAALEPFVQKALGDPRVDALVVPIGRGELLCRKSSNRQRAEA